RYDLTPTVRIPNRVRNEVSAWLSRCLSWQFLMQPVISSRVLRGTIFVVRPTLLPLNVALATAAAAGTTLLAQGRGKRPAQMIGDPAIKAALEAAKTSEPQTIEDQIRFCEIPAPSFKEAARGEALRQAFQQLGLRNVRVDKAGNVLGDRPGAAPRP